MAGDDHHKHFTGSIAQKAIIEKDGKVLLVQYPSKDPVGEVWDLPGGRFHDDETPLEGLQRELREEIGAEVDVEGPLVTGTFDFVNKDGSHSPKLYFVLYRAHLIDPEQELVPEEGEIERISWFDPKEIFELNLLHREEYREALKDILV